MPMARILLYSMSQPYSPRILEPTMRDTEPALSPTAITELSDAYDSENLQTILDCRNQELSELRIEIAQLEAALVSKTMPKYTEGQVLQCLDIYNKKQNVQVLSAYPSAEGWQYACRQARSVQGTKIVHVAQHHLFDVDLTFANFYDTAPTNVDAKGEVKIRRVVKTLDTEAKRKRDELLNFI